MKPPFPAPITEWHNDTYEAIDPKRPELSQAGKHIVITGAGSGIGREIAQAFAEAGAETIHILGRTKQSLDETHALVEAKFPNARVIVHVADMLDAAALRKAATKIGRWDVLVANAGYIPKPDLIETGDANEWWKIFEINIKGNYTLAREFLPYKNAGGTIVANSSGFAFLPPGLPCLAKNSAYSTSKLGTARFYEFLAVEHPDLSVFILQPAIVRTALYTKGELSLDDTVDTIQLPAHFTVWLASPEAKALSGRFLFGNWDVEQLKSQVAPRIKEDPVFLGTSIGGFPFSS